MSISQRIVLAAVLLLLTGAPARAQNTVVASCTAPGKNYPLGSVQPGTMDVTGLLCTNAQGGGGGTFNGTVTQGPAGPAWNVQGLVNVQGTVKIQDGLGNNITSTNNYLNVNLAQAGATVTVAGSGSFAITCNGTAPCNAVDEAAFTAGTSTYSTIGGLYQTTATSNALTNGQAGIVQVTANRALFENPRDSGGTEISDATNHVMRIMCASGPGAAAACNQTDAGSFTASSSGYANVGGVFQTTPTSNALTNGQAGTLQLTANRAAHVNLRDSGGTEAMNTTAHAANALLVDSGGGNPTDATNHAILAEAYTINNAAAQPHVCGSYVTAHITSATDTQLLAASGSKNIFICDFDFSATAALNFFFEKSSSGTCASPTRVGLIWTVVANQAKGNFKAIYTGFNTGGSQQLCINTSAGNLDVGVSYDQY